MFLFLILGCPPPDDPDTGMDTAVEFIPAPSSRCDCHPQHVEEWEGSAMHAASSPTFLAFEMLMNRASNGAFAHGSGTPNENFLFWLSCSICCVARPVTDNRGEWWDFQSS